MRKYLKLFIFTFTILIMISQLIPIYEVEARPGGGSSYRSRSRSYSSSSSNRRSYSGGSYVRIGGGRSSGVSSFEDVLITIIIIIIIIVVLSKLNKGVKIQSLESYTITGDFQEKIKTRKRRISDEIQQLKQHDQDFSKILFLDFVNSLYNKFYSYLNENKINTLRPFISETIINDVKMNYSGRINEIVVGSINIISINTDGFNDYITVDIDANYTLWREDKGIRYLTIERWKFFRKKDVLSKSPEIMRSISCPNCASPTDFTDSGECNYCKTFINKGDMQWALQSRTEIDKEQFAVKFSGIDQQEDGNQIPTIINDKIEFYLDSYLQRNKINDFEEFWQNFKENIVKIYFKNIYKSWSENNLIHVRSLLSDRLYDSFSFWIYNYKRDGLVNKLENIRIHNIDMADVELDRYYDSITVRIFASGHDYIQNNNGKVVSGSKTFERKFTEYWTFIKKSGLKIDEKKSDISKCPNCSAPIENIGQAGKCEYCGSKISTGDFSWVLSIITQDEVYQG